MTYYNKSSITLTELRQWLKEHSKDNKPLFTHVKQKINTYGIREQKDVTKEVILIQHDDTLKYRFGWMVV